MEKPELDPELLERLCHGEREAQGILWRKFHSYLYFQVFNQGARSKDDIEEIVEDIFLRVFKSIHRFRRESRFTTWLYTLTRNSIFDYYRLPRNKKASSEIEFSDIEDQWVSPEGNTKRTAPAEVSLGHQQRTVVLQTNLELAKGVSGEGLDRIHSVILKLPPTFREVLLFRLVLVFSMKETAEMIGRTESGTRTLACRALAELRKCIKEDPYFLNQGKGGDELETPV